jgi:hypothetical protein
MQGGQSQRQQNAASRTFLRASSITWVSPSSMAATTMEHIDPTIAAVDELSAPPERGSKKPDAPERRR